jgi:hypothetical protein
VAVELTETAFAVAGMGKIVPCGTKTVLAATTVPAFDPATST